MSVYLCSIYLGHMKGFLYRYKERGSYMGLGCRGLGIKGCDSRV